MKKLIVNAETKQYPIYITDSFDDLPTALISAGFSGRNAAIITDSNVGKIYLNSILDKITNVFSSVCHYEFSAGEENKNLNIISDFYRHFFENKLDRGSVVIALGGGVTGDMAGFAAATYMRGINLVQIPTSLLSQVDSSVGGKTGVDFMGAKNIIGSFYQPDFVYINSSTLKTLPNEQFVSGMGEVIKHGFLRDKTYLEYINENRDKIIGLEKEVIEEIIYRSCSIKAEVVGLDEKESGIRETLNLGHTFGHAVESLYDFKMLHGHCVGIGMCAALYLSYKKGDISNDELQDALDLIRYFGLPISLHNDERFNAEEIYKLMLVDKKTKTGNINLVLLKEIGEAYAYKNAPLDEIMEGIAFMEKSR